MVTGHGDRAGGHYRQWFRKKHPNWRELVDPANELPHEYSCPQAYRTPIPADSYPTAYIRESAKSYLEGRKGTGQPFFAFVSFADPHHPFNPPGKYWDMYDPDDFDLPVRFEDCQSPPNGTMAAIAGLEDAGLNIGDGFDVFSKETVPILELFRPGILSAGEDVTKAGQFLAQASVHAAEHKDQPPMQQMDRPEMINQD